MPRRPFFADFRAGMESRRGKPARSCVYTMSSVKNKRDWTMTGEQRTDASRIPRASGGDSGSASRQQPAQVPLRRGRQERRPLRCTGRHSSPASRRASRDFLSQQGRLLGVLGVGTMSSRRAVGHERLQGRLVGWLRRVRRAVATRGRRERARPVGPRRLAPRAQRVEAPVQAVVHAIVAESQRLHRRRTPRERASRERR